MQVTLHDGQQIWLIFVSQEGYDGRTRKNIFYFVLSSFWQPWQRKLIFQPKWYNESTEIAQIQSNIIHNCFQS